MPSRRFRLLACFVVMLAMVVVGTIGLPPPIASPGGPWFEHVRDDRFRPLRVRANPFPLLLLHADFEGDLRQVDDPRAADYLLDAQGYAIDFSTSP